MVAAHEEAEEEEDDAREGVGGDGVTFGGLPCVEGYLGFEGSFQG